MLAGLPLLLSCVAAGVIPLDKRSGATVTQLDDAIQGAVGHLGEQYGSFNKTALVSGIQNSLPKPGSSLPTPADIVSAIESAVSDVIGEGITIEQEVVHDIEQFIASHLGIQIAKRDVTYSIGEDIVNIISGAVNTTLNISTMNKQAVLHDIETVINSKLDSLHQKLELLDPLHIAQVIESAVNTLTGEAAHFKTPLIQNIESSIASHLGIQIAKRDVTYNIGEDIVNIISGAVNTTLNISTMNKQAVLHDIETVINSKLDSLHQKLELLDPLHIAQVIESAVNTLTGEAAHFKTPLIQNIESSIASHLGIQIAKRDVTYNIGEDIVNIISGAVNTTLNISTMNKQAVLHDIETVINSKLDSLHQKLELLDPLHIAQVIESAVNTLTGEAAHFKTPLIQNIESSIASHLGIQI